VGGEGGVVVVAALRGGWCLLGDFMGTLGKVPAPSAFL
jgi:hypothetical protein